MMKFGEKLIQLIKEKGFSRKDLAVRCGWDTGDNPTARITQYTSGTRRPRPEDLRKISEALGLSVEQLIADTDYPKELIFFSDKQEAIGKVPLILWHQIPNICNNLDLLEEKAIETIDITFKKVKNLFASKIPKTITPGVSNNAFTPGDLVLIGPGLDPIPSQPVIFMEKGWLQPAYAHYWLQGETKTIQYPGEINLRKLTDDIIICGAVVARICMYIDW